MLFSVKCSVWKWNIYSFLKALSSSLYPSKVYGWHFKDFQHLKGKTELSYQQIEIFAESSLLCTWCVNTSLDIFKMPKTYKIYGYILYRVRQCTFSAIPINLGYLNFEAILWRTQDMCSYVMRFLEKKTLQYFCMWMYVSKKQFYRLRYNL